MDAYLEVWTGAGAEPHLLDREKVAVGRASTNDLVLGDDPQISRAHAVLERYPSGWSIRDLSSANGTKVNGSLITSERHLRPGDEITLGTTRLVLRQRTTDATESTITVGDRPPDLTRREHDVLVELCRPTMSPGPFAQPATSAEIAEALVVSEATVKFHLANLYDKFDVGEPSATRRARLAEAALVRGAVQRAELRDPTTSA